VVLRAPAEAPLRVNRSNIRLVVYWYCSENRDNNPYHLLRSYCSGTMSKVENGVVQKGDAPEGCRNKLNKWLNAFVPAWLDANPGVWVEAEREGRLKDVARCHTDIQALQARILELQQTIINRQEEAAAYEEKRECRLFPAQNVVVTQEITS
jgi:hypothetical protein